MVSTKEKGDVVEQVVAWLQRTPGVVVQRNVRLPMLGSRRKRRDIDVLLTAYVGGHEVRLAIECKNEDKRIGSPKIDQFVGKLQAVGIPPSLGIYVSASGYTDGALEAARAAGVRPMLIDGLTEDRLSLAVMEAFQSVVVLLPDVVGINLINDLDEQSADMGEAFMFFDAHGQPVGTIPDYVWHAWRTGELEAHVGATFLRLNLPEGWHNVIAGQRQPIRALFVTLEVVALILTFVGAVSRPALVGAETGEIISHGVTATFDPPVGTYQLQTFRTESDLINYFTSHGFLHVAHRIRSPRLRFWNMMFWPPSQRVTDIITERMRAFAEGRISDPRPFSFEQLEGSDLSAAWEPIAQEYLKGISSDEGGATWRPG